MANHGLIDAICAVLEREQKPLTVKEVTRLVDDRFGVPFVNKEQNIGALLAMEVHKPEPRWRKERRGVYAAREIIKLVEEVR